MIEMQDLKTLPRDERPRERLLARGAGALSDPELLAVLLRTGRQGLPVLQMSHELLEEVGGIAGLLAMDASRLRRPGLAGSKVATLLAAVELGRRLAHTRLVQRELLDQPAAVAGYLIMRYGERDQEVMGALFLDVRNRLIAESEIFRGTLSRAAVEPRAVLKEALLRSASALILFHNHPSGDPSPSVQDLRFTRRMSEAGELLGIRLIDHLILGSAGSWVSLRRRGAW
jgi:DNA repair protein RadC